MPHRKVHNDLQIFQGEASSVDDGEAKSTRRSMRSPMKGCAWSLVLSVGFLAAIVRHHYFSTEKNGVSHKKEGSFKQQFSWTTPSFLTSPPRKYDTVLNDPKILNVHVISHTHDDVGWLKTVEQYYYGYNNSIQHVSVKDILDSVVEALLENPSRTFTYVEMKFFTMWWEQQSEGVKESVRHLVANRQLTFANGGWCMHDEAATHFMGMIDQTTLGHSFLKREFNVTPRVGWQLDPFGHSATQASLMTYKMGFDALYFGRIDYQDLSKRHADRECEGLWNASSSWSDSSVFWGLTGSYGGNYGPPTGFCFDIHCDADYHPIVELDHDQLMRAINNFLLEVRQQSDRTKGNHVMLTMGSDFQYQRASINFANNDLLLGTIQHLQEWGMHDEVDIASIFGPQYDKVNIFYSSPDYYTECKYKETLRARTRIKHDNKPMATIRTRSLQMNATILNHKEQSVDWTVKQDDFFPYSDCPNCFWTGYFTSRPALKRLERVSSSFLMAARQIDALPDSNNTCAAQMHQLEDASGVLQHHDGVSGTSKQHVAYDYAKRVQAGIDAVVPCTILTVKQALLGDKADSYLKDLSFCQLLNETKCDVAMKASSEGDRDIYMVVYNSLAQERDTTVRLPVNNTAQYTVEVFDEDSNGSWKTIATQCATNGPFSGIHILPVKVENIPPFGGKVIRIRKSLRSNGVCGQGGVYSTDSDAKIVTVFNGLFSVGIETETGSIRQIGSREIQNLTTWGYYTSFDWKYDRIIDNDHQNSGAYIFRPKAPDQKLQEIPVVDAKIVNTSAGVDVHTTYEGSWIETITRISKGVPYIEIDYTVGPIPSEDLRGREVVARYNTMVENKANFFTDSNGREFIRRKRNHRPSWDMTVYEPVAGNYYPVNAAMYVEDDDSAFAMITDRTQGGASIEDGTLELMVHRRTLVDDWRGVAEPINETDDGITPCPPWGNATRKGHGLVIKGTHRILIAGADKGAKKSGAALARAAMDEAFADPLVFVGSAPSRQDIPFMVTEFSGLKEALPENAMLITKQRLYEDSAATYLIRLGHQYGVGEDPELSKPVHVDLRSLFPQQTVTSIQEITLSGNFDLSVWQEKRFDWTGQDITSIIGMGADFSIEIQAMDIRTFRVIVK